MRAAFRFIPIDYLPSFNYSYSCKTGKQKKGIKTMAEEKLVLYHTGYDVIKLPDLSIGRRNADLGPGFYTSVDRVFP